MRKGKVAGSHAAKESSGRPLSANTVKGTAATSSSSSLSSVRGYAEVKRSEERLQKENDALSTELTAALSGLDKAQKEVIRLETLLATTVSAHETVIMEKEGTVASLKASLADAIYNKECLEKYLERQGVNPVTLSPLQASIEDEEKRKNSMDEFRNRVDRLKESVKGRREDITKKLGLAEQLAQEIMTVAACN